MKRIYTIAFTFMVLLSVTMSATALTSKTIYRQNGMQAYAGWLETSPSLNTYTELFVTQSNAGTDVYLSICTYDSTTGYWSCKSGSDLITQDNVFSMDNKLDSASLSEVEINVYDWSTAVSETFKVKATWTGTGDVSTGSYKWMSKYGNFMAKSSYSSSYREATAQGTLNNDELGTSAYGGLAKFKSMDMSMTK